MWERPLRKADHAALGATAPDGDILGAQVPDEGVKHALIAEELITEAWLARAPAKLVRTFLQNRE